MAPFDRSHKITIGGP